MSEDLERRVSELTAQLDATNKELESLSYAVSHDLRAPLRHLRGFSDLLLERLGRAEETTVQYARTSADAAQRMGRLIDELLALSQAARAELHIQDVDLNALISYQECFCPRLARRGRYPVWRRRDAAHLRRVPCRAGFPRPAAPGKRAVMLRETKA